MKITDTTMWNATHFPAAMRSLSPSTRLKAIEIANRLMAQGELTKQQIIAISVAEARRIARQLAAVGESNRSYFPKRS